MKNGHPRFYKILDELAELHSNKNHDYATVEKPFGNFERVAHIIDYYNLLNAPCKTEVKVSTIYMLKQFDCFMQALCSGKQMKVEGLKERLRDIVAYDIITEILLEEENGI